MNISLKWLNKYIDLSDVSVEEIATALPMIGLEVESLKTLGMPQIDNLVVGQILSRDQHPNADKLGVCMVQIAQDKEPIQIVCGASNYKVMDKVPVAMIGAKLPAEDGFFEIKLSKLRGVESNGMMCSARELGMGQDHSGLLILDENLTVGTPINDIFTDTDTVFEIELTANRGDCLSHIGVARDLAAKFGKELNTPKPSHTNYFTRPTSELLTDLVVETENCPLYTAVAVRNLKVAESPEWLKRDLEAIGLRPINNVVDITNYVMMEYGQPLHAFDAKDISTKKIVIRQAVEGEKLKTLDSKEHTLSPLNMVICDGDTAIGLAGVMGGENSEVKCDTTDIILESAYFNAGNIRGTSRKLNIHTDASYRFARDVDPASVFAASQRAVDLLIEIAGGTKEGDPFQVGTAPRGDRSIEISHFYIEDRLGFEVAKADVVKVFSSLGFTVEDLGEKYNVLVPSFRAEVDRAIDLVEEFIRIFGSDKIPEVRVTTKATFRDDDKTYQFETKVSDLLAYNGFNECQHYTLRDSKICAKLHPSLDIETLKLDNPLTSDQDCIRPSLLDGLLDAVKLNLDAQNAFKGLFEIGKVFRATKGEITELMSVGFVFCPSVQSKQWKSRENTDLFTAKKYIADIMSLLNIDRYNIELNDDAIFESGFAGKAGIYTREGYSIEFGALNLSMLRDMGINCPIFAGEVVLKSDVCNRKKATEKFQAFSLFPASTRDLALIVDKDIKAASLIFEISKLAAQKAKGICDIDKVDIFDSYEGESLGENKKSLAFSISFRAANRTLKTEEVAKIFDAICADLSKKYQLRAS